MHLFLGDLFEVGNVWKLANGKHFIYMQSGFHVMLAFLFFGLLGCAK